MRKAMADCGALVRFAFLAALIPTFALGGETLELDRGAAPHNPRQPQVAVDAQGTIHIVYGIGDLARYRRSDDGDNRIHFHPVTYRRGRSADALSSGDN